jgi:transposase-like protein
MGKATTKQEKLRQAKARLRRIQHFEQVTHNVSRTCRFFGVSRGQFYTWLRRYREHGLEGLKNLKSGARKPHLATPPHIVALILRVRAERQYGPIRISRPRFGCCHPLWYGQPGNFTESVEGFSGQHQVC